MQWLAAQPWSNGKVGMLGCSYLGGTTVHVASTAPPALKAIFTGATDLDKYAFVRRGGITAQFNTRPDEPLSDDLMSVPLDEDEDGSLLRAAVAEHARNTPMAPLWYGMPFRDSVSPLTGNRFWEEAGPYPYLPVIRKAGIATYFWSNWQDEPTGQVLQLAANLGGKLLVGPGSHCVPPPGYDLGREVRRYFDHHLLGRDSGLYSEPRVTWHLDGAPPDGEWIRSAKLPGEGVARSRHVLAGGGELAPGARARDERSFAVDYDVGSADYFAFWITSQAAHGLTWMAAPLDVDRVLVGSSVIDLELRSIATMRICCVPGGSLAVGRGDGALVRPSRSFAAATREPALRHARVAVAVRQVDRSRAADPGSIREDAFSALDPHRTHRSRGAAAARRGHRRGSAPAQPRGPPSGSSAAAHRSQRPRAFVDRAAVAGSGQLPAERILDSAFIGAQSLLTISST